MMNRWYQLYFALADDNKFGLLGKAVNRIVARIVKAKLERQLPIYYLHHPLDCGINTICLLYTSPSPRD